MHLSFDLKTEKIIFSNIIFKMHIYILLCVYICALSHRATVFEEYKINIINKNIHNFISLSQIYFKLKKRRETSENRALLITLYFLEKYLIFIFVQTYILTMSPVTFFLSNLRKIYSKLQFPCIHFKNQHRDKIQLEHSLNHRISQRTPK